MAVILLDTQGVVQLFGRPADLVLPRGIAVAIYAFFGFVGGSMGRKIPYMIWRKEQNSIDGDFKSDGCDNGIVEVARLGFSPRGPIVSSRSTSCKRLPFLYVVCAFAGAGIIAVGYLFDFAVVQPVGIFLVTFGHGFAQNLVCRNIDLDLPKEANLAAYTLFLGLSFAGAASVWAEPAWLLDAIARKNH